MNSEFQANINSRELKKAIVVFFLGLLFPIIFKHENFKIYDSIIYGLDNWDKEYILIAMFKLVFLNTVRSYPIYLSMIMLFDAFSIKKRGKKIIYRKMILISLVIPLAYIIINMFYKIYLPFGKTSILGLIWFFYYMRLDFENVNSIEKYFVFLFFIIGLQWLDVSTYLNFLGVGEITLFLNQAINFMGAKRITTILCMSFFFVFMLVSVLLLYFFKWQEENINRQKSEIENRYLKEIQHVVHDLKTPIFSIGTLVEILDMQDDNKKHKEYFSRIENSLEKLNLLIEEILYRNVRKIINLKDIVDLTLSILSVNEKSKDINFENYIYKKHKIYGNRILLSRVLINIITNSWEANSKTVNLILKEYNNKIVIKIEDYGDGIDGTVDKLMEEGFSTKNSSGKGLTFVKNVLEEIGAKYYIFKKKKRGNYIYSFRGGNMSRILIIDDAKEICFAISEYFNLKNWEVEVAYDIETGLDKLRAKKFDVIIVDYNLPYINGVVGTRLIRQVDKDVLIIALTILGEEDVAESFFKAGANDFAVKPIKMLDLFYRIKSHLGKPMEESVIKIEDYPKGIDKNTYKLIEDYLKSTDKYVDVSDIAREIAVAKKTVNRYLKYMVSENVLTVNLIYGKIGRPRKEYKILK